MANQTYLDTQTDEQYAAEHGLESDPARWVIAVPTMGTMIAVYRRNDRGIADLLAACAKAIRNRIAILVLNGPEEIALLARSVEERESFEALGVDR